MAGKKLKTKQIVIQDGVLWALTESGKMCKRSVDAVGVWEEFSTELEPMKPAMVRILKPERDERRQRP